MCIRVPSLVALDRKSTRLNSSHMSSSYAVFCLKKKKTTCTSHRISADHIHSRHLHFTDRLHLFLFCCWSPTSRKRQRRHSLCFFFNDTATTEIYTLSLHDALPI